MSEVNYFSLALIDPLNRLVLASELVPPTEKCPKMTLTVEGHLGDRDDILKVSLDKLERQFDADIESLKNTLTLESSVNKEIKVLNLKRNVNLVVLKISSRTILKLRNAKDNRLVFLTYKQVKEMLEDSKITLSVYAEKMLDHIKHLLVEKEI
jgi:hypothetical protein